MVLQTVDFAFYCAIYNLEERLPWLHYRINPFARKADISATWHIGYTDHRGEGVKTVSRMVFALQ